MPGPAIADSLKKMTALRFGAKISIRPIELADLDAAYNFFQAMPREDRNYLRFDITNKSILADRIRQAVTGVDRKRLIALVDGKIAATGILEFQSEGWTRDVAEMRLIVGRDYRRKGLGKLMARELFMLCAREKVEEILVQMMRPQKAARSIMKRLGFREEHVLKNYARDFAGNKQDLILMRCKLADLWREMESHVQEFDWQQYR